MKKSQIFTVLLYGNGFAATVEINASKKTIIGRADLFFVDSDEAWCFEKEFSWSSITEMDLDITDLVMAFTSINVTTELFVKKPLNSKATDTERKIFGILCRILGVS